MNKNVIWAMATIFMCLCIAGAIGLWLPVSKPQYTLVTPTAATSDQLKTRWFEAHKCKRTAYSTAGRVYTCDDGWVYNWNDMPEMP